MKNTEDNAQFIAVFECFERHLNRYYKSIEEERKYPDSKLAEVSSSVAYGYCNGIELAISKLGLSEEFFRWAKEKNLNYYEVLKLATPHELRGKEHGAYFTD